MFSFADSLGAPLCSTGHYARTVREGDTVLLKKAADETKDQTYVLWNLTQEMLCRLKFPLGGFTKSQIREIAAEAGLECAASKDSQDICFIPDGDYAAYIERCSGFGSALRKLYFLRRVGSRKPPRASSGNARSVEGARNRPR